jgi:hypothetical protein
VNKDFHGGVFASSQFKRFPSNPGAFSASAEAPVAVGNSVSIAIWGPFSAIET